MIFTENSALNNKIISEDSNYENINAIINELKCSFFTAQILDSRKIKFQNLKLILNRSLKEHWKDPSNLPNFQESLNLTKKIIKEQGKIGIIGDYDVDGICATIILKETFEKFNIQTIEWIPTRSKGYGPNEEALEFFKNSPVDLLFLLDCGTNNHDFCHQYGKNIIIIDHHNSVNSVKTLIINPNKENINPLEQGIFKEMCATQLTYLFISQILKQLQLPHFEIQEILKSKLDLVALATTCDMMPMNLLNQAFIKEGIKVIETGKRIGLNHLINLARIKLPITTKDIAFSIGPRINAAGRIETPQIAFDLLSAKSYEQSSNIIHKIEQINNYRKEIQEEIFKEALEMAKQSEDKIIFIASKNWNLGVVGIIAAMIQEELKKPTIVGSIIENEIKASARSNSINIGLLIQQAVEKELLIKGGGHSAAAGLTCDINQFEKFKKWMNEIEIENIQTILKIDICSTLKDIEKDYIILAPFGLSNLEPKILVKNLIIRKIIDKNTYHQIILEENFQTYMFFLNNKKEILINKIKNAEKNLQKINVIFNLPEKGNYEIIDFYSCLA